MKLHPLSPYNYLISELADGDDVPAGFSFWGNKETLLLKNDIGNLTDFCARCMAGIEKLSDGKINQSLKNYLTDNKIDCSFDIFKKAYIFASAMKAIYPDFNTAFSSRSEKFSQNEASLSGNLSEGHAACLEVSVLAAQCMERSGLKASVLVGETLDDLEDRDPSDHTVVLIKQDSQFYIFDAVNFIRSPNNNTWMPSIYNIQKEQYDALFGHIDPTKQRMAEAISIYGDKTKYFGYGDRSGVMNDELIPQSKKNNFIL